MALDRKERQRKVLRLIMLGAAIDILVILAVIAVVLGVTGSAWWALIALLLLVVVVTGAHYTFLALTKGQAGVRGLNRIYAQGTRRGFRMLLGRAGQPPKVDPP